MTNVNTPVQQAPPQQQQVQQSKRALVDDVLAKISQLQSTGDLRMPVNYSHENSVRSAWLMLQDITGKDGGEYKPVLSYCTPNSIANALLKMVLQGLNPNKHQCSFIAYGNKLTMQREYAGSIAIAKRNGMKSVTAQVVYEGDEFEFLIDTESALKKVTKHIQTLASMSSGKIVGAYAMVELVDGRKSVEVMTMAQIQAAWNQGATKGQSPAHKNFPDQMAMKSVINRAVKLLINSSDDSDLFDDDEPLVVDTHAVEVRNEIVENANKQEIGFDDAEDFGKNDPTQTAEPIQSSSPEPVTQQAQQDQSNSKLFTNQGPSY